MADLTSAARSATRHARRWWILAVLCMSVLLAAIDNTIVNVALPTLSRQIGASTSDLQWVVDAYAVAFTSLLLVCGNIGDHLGRRRVLHVGLVLFARASLAAALSTTVDQLSCSPRERSRWFRSLCGLPDAVPEQRGRAPALRVVSPAGRSRSAATPASRSARPPGDGPLPGRRHERSRTDLAWAGGDPAHR